MVRDSEKNTGMVFEGAEPPPPRPLIKEIPPIHCPISGVSDQPDCSQPSSQDKKQPTCSKD